MSFLHRLFKGRHGPAAGVAVPKLSSKVAKPGSDGRPYPALTTLIAEFVESDEPAKTLVLGDSVMERIAREDEDRRTLGDMIADEFASRRTAIICAACNNPLVYRWLLAVLQAMPNQPKSIILPINMRAFSPQWHLNPDWQMTQELTLLREYLLRKPQVFPAIDDVYRNSRAHADFAEMQLDYQLSARRTMREFRALASETPSSERNRELFVFHYGHQLNAAHPKLSALRDAVALAKSIAERVLLYVTPVNVDAAARYAGQALSEIMRINIDVLRSNVPLSIIDWHDALPDTAFFHGDIATEHLNETGRANLARRIVNAHA